MSDQTPDRVVQAPRARSGIGLIRRAGLSAWGLGLGGLSLFFGLAEVGESWVNLFAHAMLTGVIVALAWAAWKWPRAGGAALAGAGALGMWYFPQPFAIWVLAFPALILGLIGVISGK